MSSSLTSHDLIEGLRTSCNNLVRRMVRLPLSILDGVLRVIGHETSRRNPSYPEPPQQTEDFGIVPEEWYFLNVFEQQYGESHPFFYANHFIETLNIAKNESKLVFLYLHSPDHPFIPPFCQQTLCSELVVQFLDANFVSWGAVASRGEGLEMAKALRVSSFPFCAVVAPATGKAIAVLQQVEGPVSPEALIQILQRTLDELGSAFRFSKAVAEEEIRVNRRLREEQDKAYLEALQKDKVIEMEHNLECIEHSSDSCLCCRKKRTFCLQHYAAALHKGINNFNLTVFQPILLRLMFRNSGVGSYQLISNFPRKVYGHEQLDMTLSDAGLHPNAALFLELIS